MEPPGDKIKPNKGRTEDEDVEGSLGRSTKDALGDGGVESYSGAGREGTGQDMGNFVCWSSSTEIGDFIRDPARAKEFGVDIEGHADPIKVSVPPFNDRTFYLRQRL
jgi:hypothetical protein